MCGIFGEFIYKGDFDLERSLQRLNLLEHRGPDGFGFEYGNFHEGKYAVYHNAVAGDNNRQPCSRLNYFFGHRRLSIIDLSENAFQPMTSIDNRYSISFNGEIYNYIELKEELVKKGCIFKTDHSDTEVLLNAYLVWGKECLGKLRGMFSFAILDRENKVVFMARDRIGQKPMYYELSEDRFSFASELGPILQYPETTRDINLEALGCYLAFGYVPHPISIFKGINKLPPATCALVDLKEKTISLEKYWDVGGVEDLQSSFADVQQEVEKLFADAVEFRLRSDVPAGAFISGGTDSTLVVKKMKEVGKKKFDIFGADFPQPDQSERVYIEEAAARYSQNLNLSLVDLSHTENIKDIIRVFDEPFDGGSSIALFDLFKVAQKNYKVILTGDGGDEMFAGYPRYLEFPPRHKFFKFLQKIYLPEIGLALLSQLGIKRRKTEKMKKLLRGGLVSNYLIYHSDSEMVKLMKGQKGCSPDQHELFGEIQANIDKYKLSPIKALQYFEMNTILPGRMLYKLDRFSMYYGVEARSPFLDHKLVEKAFSIPNTFNINNGETKVVLKKILEQDFNKKFVYRKKHGFGNPLRHWFEQLSSKEVFGILIDEKSFIYQYLDYQRLHNAFPQIKNGFDGTKEKGLWRLLVLGHYLENVRKIIRHDQAI